MENNEDKRTPVQREIERQKIKLNESKIMLSNTKDKDFKMMARDKIRSTAHAITVLQSLLEPEKEALMDAFIDGKMKTNEHGEEIMSPDWFTSTYTQQTK
jgi:hypothetical protein